MTDEAKKVEEADDGLHYPNLEPPEGPMGNLISFTRILQDKKIPQIAWGQDFENWPRGKQLMYAKKLASAMNHAADILQQERNKLAEIITHQEKQLAQLKERMARQDELLQKVVAETNAERNQLASAVMRHQREMRAMKKYTRGLEERLQKAWYRRLGRWFRRGWRRLWQRSKGK